MVVVVWSAEVVVDETDTAAAVVAAVDTYAAEAAEAVEAVGSTMAVVAADSVVVVDSQAPQSAAVPDATSHHPFQGCSSTLRHHPHPALKTTRRRKKKRSAP